MNSAVVGDPRAAYQPRLFVERDELKLIIENIQLVKEGKAVKQPIINFWGVNGIGKSWLLHHLRQEYQAANQRGTSTFYYDFNGPFSWPALLQSLASVALAQFSGELFPQGAMILERSGEPGMVTEFINDIFHLSHNHQVIPVFLFDSTENIKETDWQSLEAMLIEPLAMSGRAIFVLAGRRPIPKWHRFEARRRVMAVEKTQVSPFTETQVRSQIEKGNYDFPAEVLIDNAAGNPWLVDTLAHTVAPDGRLEKKIARILATYEKQLLEGIADELCDVLYLAIPLRFYRVEALRFLAEKQPKQVVSIDANYLQLLRRLESETVVVLWHGQRRAWMTDEMVRRIINRQQFLGSRQRFKRQHKQAQELYWRWAGEYPTACEDFILEIWFHLANVYRADGNGKRLRAGVYEALDFAHQQMSRSEDRLIVLQHQFQYDQELQELLPEEVRYGLAHDLERGLIQKAAG
jgi:hypothetical protein